MANNPLTQNLPADLPTNWQNGQIVAPLGASVGLSTQHGYNYLMQQGNASQSAINTIGAAFSGVFGKNETIPIANGGTNATTISGARTNLSVYSKSEVDGLLSPITSSITSLGSTKLNTIGKGINMLDNWDFRNPLNSRGQSSYGDVSAFVGSIDRWWVSDSATLSLVTGGINITQRGDNIWASYIFQRNKGDLMPATYTFSVLFAENTGVVALTNYFTDTSVVETAISYQNAGLLSFTFTVPERLDTNLAFQRIHASSARIIAAKLELGEESTLAKQVSGTWVINDPSPNYAENILRCAMNGDAGDPYSNFSFPYIASGSYIGTGFYGENYPNPLSFSFAPKIIWCADDMEFMNGTNSIHMLYMPLVSTTYSKYCGFAGSGAKSYAYGKKSTDGKTIYWYCNSSSYGAGGQLNSSGTTYYYTAIG